MNGQRLSQLPTSTLGEIDPRRPLTLNNFVPVICRAKQFGRGKSARGRKYIKVARDISFQFVPSQRMRVQSQANPFDVYRALRIINPSPFMFYLKSPACTLIGSSPEILCRVLDGEVTSRPLAGTRPRGATPEEDAALEKELLAGSGESVPSTSCWSICTATMSAASQSWQR